MQSINRNFSHYQPGTRLPVKSHKKRRLPVRPIAVAAFVIASGLIAHNAFASSGGNQPDKIKDVKSASVTKIEAAPEPPKKTVELSGLQPALSQIIKKYPYDTSVTVVELNSGKLVQAGDSYPFIAASTTKLLSALLYLNNVETGHAGMDDKLGDKPAREQLRLMVNQSDNDAWTKINDSLTHESMNAYAKNLGINGYDADKNTITSNDMARLLEKLYKRELLNDEHTKLLLSWMQKTSEERFIPPAVTNGSQLYHKSGYLEDRAHDVAIIDNGSTPFAVVIYSKSYGKAAYDFTTGEKLFRDVTKQVLSTFNQ